MVFEFEYRYIQIEPRVVLGSRSEIAKRCDSALAAWSVDVGALPCNVERILKICPPEYCSVPMQLYTAVRAASIVKLVTLA